MIDREILNKLLKFGVERGASDIHFEVGGPPRYRIRGELLKAKYEKLTPDDTLTIANILLGERTLDMLRLFAEQDASYSLPGIARFRASIFKQRGSVGCVLRVIPFYVPGFVELNLPATIQEIAGMRRGLVLVTGATGNGKSTTIAAMLQHINTTRQAHIVTIEDPIEYLLESQRSLVIQREVGTDTHSYSDAMVAALRQDPDVIMLGEIRDAESAGICLKAAETGHFVISTLHTPDVTSTIKRFMGFFENTQLEMQLGRFAEGLQAIVALRLLPLADGTGVFPAVEILRVTHGVQESLRDIKRHGEILQHMEKGRELYGMQTFDQHLVELVRDEIITLETAKIAASRPADFERSLLVD